MEPVFFVMALMGCGDAGDMCTQARVEPVRYTSIQACQAQANAALLRNTDLDFPVITAHCRSTAQQWASARVKPAG